MKYPCVILGGSSLPLEVIAISDAGTSFDLAKEVWTSRGGPEMWIFPEPGGPPWHVDCLVKTKTRKK